MRRTAAARPDEEGGQLALACVAILAGGLDEAEFAVLVGDPWQGKDWALSY